MAKGGHLFLGENPPMFDAPLDDEVCGHTL